MNDESLLLDLAAKWEDAPLSYGSPEEFCAAENCPHLVPALLALLDKKQLHSLVIGSVRKPPGAAVLHSPPKIPGFTIVGEIGRGGMGVVYKARETALDRDVAIKVLRYGSASDAARFESEAKTVATLKHPNIVEIHRVGEVDSKPYLCLELIAGGNLATRLAGLPQKPHVAANLLLAIARAVQCAHGKGIVHRDLKPANILLREAETIETSVPVISDFGLSKRIDDETNPTVDGLVFGTASYMAPEQARGENRLVGPATDIYALGAILYECLTGRPPFKAATLSETIALVIDDTVAPVTPRNLVKVPYDLETICLVCLARSPKARYAGAAELTEDLERYLAGRPILARRPSRWKCAVMWARRNPAWMAVFMGVVLAVSSGIGFYVQNQESRRLKLESELRDDRHRFEQAEERAQRQREDGMRVEKEGHERELREERDRSHRTEVRWKQEEAARQIERGLDRSREETFQLAHANLRNGDPAGALAAFLQLDPARRDYGSARYMHELSTLPRPVRSLAAHDYECVALLATPDGSAVVSAGLDGRLLVSGMSTPQRALVDAPDRTGIPMARHALSSLGEMEGWAPRPVFQQLAWIDPGRSFGSGDSTGRFLQWELATGVSKELFRHPKGRPLTALAFRDGQQLVGDADGRLHLAGEPATGTAPLVESAIVRILPLDDGAWFVLHADGSVRVVDGQPQAGRWKVLRAFQLPNLATDATLLSGTRAIVAGPVLTWIDWKSHRAPEPPEGFVGPSSSIAVETRCHPGPDQEQPGYTTLAWNPAKNRLYAGDGQGRVSDFAMDASASLIPSPSLSLPSQEKAYRPFALLKPGANKPKAVAGIVPLVGEAHLVAGQDGLVALWEKPHVRLNTEFRTGARPVVAFDPAHAGSLWVGDANGELALWNTLTASRSAAVQAHKGAIVDVAATEDGIVYTVGADLRVQFWRLEAGRPVAAREPMVLPAPPRRFAVAPDGKRFAILDGRNTVFLWNYPSLEPSGDPRSVCDATAMPPDVGGLAFDRTGTRLAAGGAQQSIAIWDLQNPAAAPRLPSRVSDRGATVLRWHPLVDQLFAGDTNARIVRDPEKVEGIPFVVGHPMLEGAIVDLAIAPDGRSMAVLDGQGHLLTRRLPIGGEGWSLDLKGLDATAVRFDPTGRRLLVARAGGLVTLYESAPPADVVRDVTASRVLSGPFDRARAIAFRAESVQCDAEGRCRVVYQRGVMDGERLDKAVVAFGEFDVGKAGSFRSQTLDTIDVRALAKNTRFSSLADTFALWPHDGNWFALHRRPTGNKYGGVPVVHALGEIPPRQWDSVPREEDNAWFHPVVWNHGPPLDLFHFEYDRQRVVRTRRLQQGWELENAGRLREGWPFSGTVAADGAAHLVLRSGPTSRGPLVHLRRPAAPSDPPTREIVDRSIGINQPRIAMDREGRSAAAYVRAAPGGRCDLVWAVRDGSGNWKPETIRHGLDAVGLYDFRRDANGRLWLLYRENGTGWCLGRCEKGNWTHVVVWSRDEPDPRDGTETPAFSAALVMGPGPEPAVLIGLNTRNESWMKLLQLRP